MGAPVYIDYEALEKLIDGEPVDLSSLSDATLKAVLVYDIIKAKEDSIEQQKNLQSHQ